MEKLTIKLASRSMFLALLSAAFLFGCQSTQTDNVEENCQNEVSDNCQAEEGAGEDRGYDPCRVNKKLSVCKK